MKGICKFCFQEKELTYHHIIAQSYKGQDISENVISNICQDCHRKLESVMNENRASTGAGKSVSYIQTFQIGQTRIYLKTGSVRFDEQGMACVDIGSPICGMRAHQTKTGETNIEAAFSGLSYVLVAGSPYCDRVVYSAAFGI